MSKTEIIFLFCMLLPLVPMGFYGQWRLFFVFLSFYIVFGLQEWLSVAQTGKSISQHFWIFVDKFPFKADIILSSMALMWAALLHHLRKKKS